MHTRWRWRRRCDIDRHARHMDAHGDAYIASLRVAAAGSSQQSQRGQAMMHAEAHLGQGDFHATTSFFHGERHFNARDLQMDVIPSANLVSIRVRSTPADPASSCKPAYN